MTFGQLFSCRYIPCNEAIALFDLPIKAPAVNLDLPVVMINQHFTGRLPLESKSGHVYGFLTAATFSRLNQPSKPLQCVIKQIFRPVFRLILVIGTIFRQILQPR